MPATTNASITAGVKFTLLGTELNAGFEKTDTVERIFVFQDVTAPSEGVTIGKLISDIETLMGKQPGEVPGLSKDDIKGKLAPVVKPGSPFDIEAIKITLATVYLKMEKPSGASGFTTEYAFRLNVSMQGLIRDDIKLINIKQLTLAVWNTQDPQIQRQLALASSSSP